jgi:hypothetical protein
MSRAARVLALLLALLPAVWTNCPCCITAQCKASERSAAAEPAKTCGCCAKQKGPTSTAPSRRGTPADCDLCAGAFHRRGAVPAPVGVDLPEPTVVAFVAPLLRDLPPLEADVLGLAAGPAPPDPVLEAHRTDVLRI